MLTLEALLVCLREEITSILDSRGFKNPLAILERENGFYQPIVIATAAE